MRDGMQRCYWLCQDGRAVGTVAVATTTLGSQSLRIGNLYVYPSDRGRSIARDLLCEARDALAERDLTLGLATDWTWQRALRLYLRSSPSG